jgi:hypothetical protein
MKLSPHRLTPVYSPAHSTFAGSRYPRRALVPTVRYLTGGLPRGCTSMHFGENQLSPGSLGISPLPTAPLTALQRGTVQASSGLSPRLALAMGGSPGFGPTRRDSVSPKGRHAHFGLARAAAPGLVPLSLATPVLLAGSFFNRHAVRGPSPPPTDRTLPVSGSISPPSPGSFSPFPHGTLLYGSPEVLAPWRVVPPASHPIPRAGWYSRTPTTAPARLSRTGLSPTPAGPSRTVPLDA